MITNFILFIIAEVINGASYILPTASMPSWFSGGVATISYYFVSWNFIFPIANFLLLIAFFISVELAVLAVFGFNAIIKVVRGSG